MDLSLWCVIQRSSNFTKHSKLWTFFYAAWLRGSAFKKKIQNFGPFSKGRGLDHQIFKNQTSNIVDLFGKPLGQRSSYFTKDPKLGTFLSGAWLRGPRYSTKHPKLWTFLSDTWLRGIDLRSKIVDLFFCGAWFRGSDIY